MKSIQIYRVLGGAALAIGATVALGSDTAFASCTGLSCNYNHLYLTRAVPGSFNIGSQDLDAGLGLVLGGPTSVRPGHLGMYVTPDAGAGTAVTFGVGGYSARTGAVGITDTAGLLPAGSLSATSKETGGSGGISGSYDASNLVGPNQKLIFTGAFNYTSSSVTFGPVLGFGPPSAGSIKSDVYGFAGSALYANNNTYVLVRGSTEFGNNSETNNITVSNGSYNSDGYSIDGRLGHVFILTQQQAVSAAPRYAKAPVVAAAPGYLIGFDLSGHLGYSKDVARGFTDTVNFTFGDEKVESGVTGLRGKLLAQVSDSSGATWFPYISGSVDWRFNYSHTASFPVQVALPIGDTVTFADGTTVVGGQLGLDVRAKNGWTVGVNGFYAHSTSNDTTGGRAYLRIPFGPTAVVARY
jgi:hypothetical protein